MNRTTQLIIAVGVLIAGLGVGYYFVILLPQSKSQTEARLLQQEVHRKVVECQKLAPDAVEIFNQQFSDGEIDIIQVKYNEADDKCYAETFRENGGRSDIIDVYNNESILSTFYGFNNQVGNDMQQRFEEALDRLFRS